MHPPKFDYVSVVLCLVLVLQVGCPSLPSWEELTLAEIEQVKNVEKDFVTFPHRETLLSVANDKRFVSNLKRITLNGDASGYWPLLKETKQLTSVTLDRTRNTEAFLRECLWSNSNITSLCLIRTDWNWVSENNLPQLDKPEFAHARLETLAQCDSVKRMVISDWDKRFSSLAIEIFPKMKSLEGLSIEWWKGSEREIQDLQSALRSAVPECNIIVEKFSNLDSKSGGHPWMETDEVLTASPKSSR